MISQNEMNQVFTDFMEVYRNRNMENYFKFLSETISGFGTGPDEIFFDKEEWGKLVNREIGKNLNPTQIEIHRTKFVPISQMIFLALVVFTRKTEISEGSFTFNKCRFTGIFQKSTDSWSLIHSHLSLPFHLQHEGESFPIKELERKNRELKEEVQQKTTEILKSNEILKNKNLALEKALTEVQRLETLLPICSYCRKIRNVDGNWEDIDDYLIKHADIKLSHGMCQECQKKHFPDFDPNFN